ncbi:MAG: hypothetical protein AABY93_01110 [Bacteroidota bacterium]
MEPKKLYHLYTHANGFENLFQSEENYRHFLRRYEHFIPSVADTLAYCLMPNHIHFLIRIKTDAEIESTFSNFNSNSNLQGFKNLGGFGGLESEIEKRISQQFSNLFNGYTKAFNKMYSRRGSLFIPNFKREEITSDNYLTNIILYIHANPVHHGFVKGIGEWPWSSYQLILNDSPTFIRRDEVLAWFGNRNEYEKIHLQPIDVKT